MKRRLAGCLGLTRPFRFERTLTVLFALILASVAGAAAVRLVLAGGLTAETPRSWYFVYVAVLIGVAVLCVPWPRMAAVALSVAALELGLGLGSAVLYRQGLTENDLLPDNDKPGLRRVWHPLLQATVPPGASYRLQDGQIRYNSLGQRGPERSLADLQGKAVVALFGGSTTEDVAVADGQSWPERLEQILGAGYTVINHGSALYSTVQIVVQTAFYERAFGVTPDCAVYYVGGIDVQNSHIHRLDPGYADYFTPSLIDSLQARRVDAVMPASSPLLLFAGRLLALTFDTARPPPEPIGTAQPDADLEAIYRRNVRTISAINRQRGITTVWVGEIVDADTLDQDVADETWAPFVRREAVWPLLWRLNEVLRREAAALSDVYVDVPRSAFSADDFVDGEHFAARGSLRFARAVAPKIADACHKRP
jgi:ABC-type amino acid transport substrate-binding protein